ncbi:hypothetical protein H0H93_016127, partial [Arthromyces matolae]
MSPLSCARPLHLIILLGFVLTVACGYTTRLLLQLPDIHRLYEGYKDLTSQPVFVTQQGVKSQMRLTLVSILALCAPSVFSSQESLVDQYVAKQGPISKAGLLANIGPTGSRSSGAKAGVVIASPSTEDPNYLYTWIRDASLVYKVLVD